MPKLNVKFLAGVMSELASFIVTREKWALPNVDSLPDDSEQDLAREANYQAPINPEDLIYVLSQYGVKGEFKDYHIGSAVTTYEVKVPIGTRIVTLLGNREDLARDLGTPSLRIVKSVQDSTTIGFEVENRDRFSVGFKSLFKGIPGDLKLPVILGEDTYGSPVYQDLIAVPHLLVAGQTGSGKSAFLNALLATLICKRTPEEVRFLIVDPKGYEFSAYKDLPHLYRQDDETMHIASEVEDARRLLDVAVDEMARRGRLFEEARVKKLEDYNATAKEKLPYIVFIVDEFADLMLMGSRDQKKDVETKIVRIAQKARAVGIHMILATQKPLASIMTSLIKANMPARVAFSVSSGVDSRVILDETGAEALTGRGDMLFRDPAARSEHMRVRRIQAPWISDKNVEALITNGR